MTVSPALRDDLLAAVPGLRAFALSLTGNVDIADDLVQESLVQVFQKLDTFEYRGEGALLAYLGEVQPGALASLRPPRIERSGEVMALDEMTRVLKPLAPSDRARAAYARAAAVRRSATGNNKVAIDGNVLTRRLN